jgi:hypothetical protein
MFKINCHVILKKVTQRIPVAKLFLYILDKELNFLSFSYA